MRMQVKWIDLINNKVLVKEIAYVVLKLDRSLAEVLFESLCTSVFSIFTLCKHC